MKVVAPMVTMAPSSMRIRSLSPRISLFRKVPSGWGHRAGYRQGCLACCRFTLIMQCVRSMLMSEVSIGTLTTVPTQRRPILLSPSCSGSTCLNPKTFSMTVMLPKASLYSVFVRILLFLRSFHLCLAQTYAELLLTVLADKYQGLAFRIFCFVESQIVLTFGATDTFH